VNDLIDCIVQVLLQSWTQAKGWQVRVGRREFLHLCTLPWSKHPAEAHHLR
jgi:hypothetical protein